MNSYESLCRLGGLVGIHSQGPIGDRKVFGGPRHSLTYVAIGQTGKRLSAEMQF